MLPFPNMLNLFMDKLACSGGRRLPFLKVSLSASDGFLFRHRLPPLKERCEVCAVRCPWLSFTTSSASEATDSASTQQLTAANLASSKLNGVFSAHAVRLQPRSQSTSSSYVAAMSSNSPAMMTEAIHSTVDIGSELLPPQ
jgi:hypothetical protein